MNRQTGRNARGDGRRQGMAGFDRQAVRNGVREGMVDCGGEAGPGWVLIACVIPFR